MVGSYADNAYGLDLYDREEMGTRKILCKTKSCILINYIFVDDCMMGMSPNDDDV